MKKYFLFAVLIFMFHSAFSQSVGSKYIWEFRDGTIIFGEFVKEESGNIYIIDEAGKEVYIPKVMIAQRHEATNENYKEGEWLFPNLHDTRYFFSPSAFGLQKGEGYYNNAYYLFWQFQYGISDQVSIGGGSSVLGIPTTVNLKYSTEIKKNLNLALGWFYVGDVLNFTDSDIGSLLNMPYVVLTKGSKEHNFTVGFSYNFSDEFNSDQMEENFVLNLGAITRIDRRFSLVFEGWILNPDDPTFLGGPGIRYFSKINRVTAKNGAGAKTVDFQLLWMDGEGPIPFIGRSWRF